MTIYTKPEGKLESEAIRIASPPGYAYIGNPRYGRWENSGGHDIKDMGQIVIMK